MLVGTHGACLGKHVPAERHGGDQPVSQGALPAPRVRRGGHLLELVLPLRQLEKVAVQPLVADDRGRRLKVMHGAFRCGVEFSPQQRPILVQKKPS